MARDPAKFVGNPHAPVEAPKISAPTTTAQRPAKTSPGSAPSGVTEDPSESSVSEAPSLEPKYWVTQFDDGSRKLFMEDADFNITDMGKVTADDANKVLDVFSEFSDETGSWENVPPHIAESLKMQKLGLFEFMSRKHDAGEAGILRGWNGVDWLSGKQDQETAQARGSIELLKMQVKDAPAIPWNSGFGQYVADVVSNPVHAGLGASRFGVGEASQVSAYMMHGAGEAGKGALMFAAVGGLATLAVGASGGTAAPITLAALGGWMQTGAAYGVFKFSVNVEAGNTALDLLDKGFDPKLVRVAAPIAGVLKGALEVVGFKYMTEPFKRVAIAKVLKSKSVKKAMSQWLKNYTKELGAEVSTEVAQTHIDNVTNNIAAFIEDKPEAMISIWDQLGSMTATAIATGAGMGIIKGPGVIIEAGVSRSSAKADAKAKAESDAARSKPEVIRDHEAEVDSLVDALAKSDAAGNPAESKAIAEEIRKVQQKIVDVKAVPDAPKPTKTVMTPEATKDLPVAEVAVAEADALADVSLAEEAVVEQAVAESPELSAVVEKAVKGTVLSPAEKTTLQELKTVAPDFAKIIDDLEAVTVKLRNPDLRTDIKKSLVAKKESLLKEAGVHAKVKRGGPKTAIREQTGQARPEVTVHMTERQALRESLRVQSRAATAAARMTQQNISSAQTQLLKLVRAAGLDDADQKDFTTAILAARNQEQLARALPGIEARMAALVEKSTIRKLDHATTKEFKNIKPRRQAGRAVSRFTPEAQKILTRLQTVWKMNQTDAAASLSKNLEDIAAKGGIPDAALALENLTLHVRALGRKASLRDWAELLQTVQALKGDASQVNKLKRLKAQADAEAQREEFVEQLEKAPKRKSGTVGDRSADSSLTGAFGRAVSWTLAWGDLAEIMSAGEKVGIGETTIGRLMDVHAQKVAETKGVRIAEERLTAMYQKAYNVASRLGKEWALETAWAADSKRTVLGEFVDAKGEKVTLELSKAEARKQWMEMQDPTLLQTFTSKDGMAYTAEMMAAVKKSLTAADMAFATDVMDFLREYYQGFNETYREMNGIDLPFNAWYSPIVRAHHGALSSENALLGELSARITSTPSAGKVRVDNIRALRRVSDVSTIKHHIRQVEHYKAWAPRIRELNGLFRNEKVRELIDHKFGSAIVDRASTILDNFTRGGIDRSKDYGWINTMKTNFTVSVLAVKPIIAVKQMVSFVASLDGIPLKAFMAGLLDFSVNMKDRAAILNKSELLQARGVAITPELAEAVDTPELNVFRTSPTIANWLLLTTKLGDRGAILLGGWAVYKHAIDSGKTPAQAMTAFEKSYESSQQSTALDQVMEWQEGNSFQRLATAFMTSQIQYLRKEIVATNAFYQGRIGVGDWAKRMVIYHLVLPMLFQWVADGFDFRKEEQKRAALLGSLNGIVILGNFLHSMASTFYGLRPWASSTILDSIMREGQAAMREITNAEELDAETMFAVIKESSEFLGVVKGLPMKSVFNIYDGFQKMSEAEGVDEHKKALKQVSGISPYILDQDQNEEED